MRVAINGLGRIGRVTLRILQETPELEVVAANDLVPVDNLAYLLRFDTVYGRFPAKVHAADDRLHINGQAISMFSQRDPSQLPWKELGVELVFECSGVFRTRDELQKHRDAGADQVILSAPPKSDGVPMIVPGATAMKDALASPIISTASCTTNCVAPVMEVLDRHLGVEKSLMTTIHSYTSSQGIVDGPNKKMRRGRAAAANMVPTSTGAASATTASVDGLTPHFDGVAVRVPLPAGSLADIVAVTKRETSKEEVINILREESSGERYAGILGVSEEELVSSDIVGDSRGSLVDATMTQVVGGNLVKVMSWYDNEWGYSSQMVRHAVARKSALATAS